MGNCINEEPTPLKTRSDSMSDDEAKSPSSADIDFSQPTTRVQHKEITKRLKRAEKEDEEIVKILLIGTGSSGKSTLFQQIECIHGSEDKGKQNMDRFFSNIDSMREMIRFNCIDSLIKLLHKSDFLSKEPYNFEQCVVDLSDQKVEDSIRELVEFSKNKTNILTNHASYDPNALAALGKTMEFLWHLEGIQETFKLRQYFSLAENLDYFMKKILIVMDNDSYEPTVDDILNARMQTTGIVERDYFIEEVQFNIFDVGGQRSERKKWLQLFDNVTALIFVAALNHYCCVLFEDENMNSMQESLTVFDDIVNSKWFSSKDQQFIVFLNKNDLFVQRLRIDRIPMSVCFGEEYRGPNYTDREEKVCDSKWFEHCYDECVKFIKQQYLSRNRNEKITTIFMHITTATEQSNVETVFNDVRTGIINQNLANSHLILE